MMANMKKYENEFQQILSDRLSKLLSDKRISIVELSEKTGISRTNIYSIIRGTADVRLQTINRIAHKLDVPITYFFGSSNDDVEKLQQLVKLLTDKIAFLEILVAEFQRETEITEMKYDLMVTTGQILKVGQAGRFKKRLRELKSIAEGVVGNKTDEPKPDDPLTPLKAMLKDTNLKIGTLASIALLTMLKSK